MGGRDLEHGGIQRRQLVGPTSHSLLRPLALDRHRNLRGYEFEHVLFAFAIRGGVRIMLNDDRADGFPLDGERNTQPDARWRTEQLHFTPPFQFIMNCLRAEQGLSGSKDVRGQSLFGMNFIDVYFVRRILEIGECQKIPFLIVQGDVEILGIHHPRNDVMYFRVQVMQRTGRQCGAADAIHRILQYFRLLALGDVVKYGYEFAPDRTVDRYRKPNVERLDLGLESFRCALMAETLSVEFEQFRIRFLNPRDDVTDPSADDVAQPGEELEGLVDLQVDKVCEDVRPRRSSCTGHMPIQHVLELSS